MRKALLIIAVIAITAPHDSYALSLADYRLFKDVEPKLIAAHLESVGTGFLWANATLNGDGQTMLYCAPPRFMMNGQNYIDLLDDYIQRDVDLDSPDTPIEMLLLNALRNEFPCEK